MGSCLYYARAIDGSILPALNEISTIQAQPTMNTLRKCRRVLDYLHSHQHAYIRYRASDMQLQVDSDAAYLVLPKAKSRVAGYYHLTNASTNGKSFYNGPIHIECKALRHVVSSAAEAEVAALYHNAQQLLPIRRALIGLGHPQPATPIKTDNSTALGFVYNNIHMKKSKAWDMRYNWLRDREIQKQFRIYWMPGTQNHGDYWTKHHPTIYHRQIRNQYIQDYDR